MFQKGLDHKNLQVTMIIHILVGSSGSIFSIGDYPDSLNAKAGDVSSIKAVWEFPRLIVGLFALIDTFLVYKIAERRYSTKIAFIAAVLFAVMPFSWMARRVLLESLQLPLLLSSVPICSISRGNKNQCENR